jgi:hypothetical protein
VDDNQMTDPGRSGDDGEVALDAALAAADEDLLAAISDGFDLDIGLARVLSDLGGSPGTRPGNRTPGHPEKDRKRPGTAMSQDRFPPIRTRDAGAAAPFDVAALILRVNGSDEAAEDQCRRARQAAGVAARSARAAELSAVGAKTAATAHQAIQAECPQRAPLPRQVTFALGTVALDGVACYVAGRALHGGQDTTRACLCAAATAGFLALGYRALRSAETPPAWRARRQARQAQQAAQAAQATADQDAAERDRLIDAYLGYVRPLAEATCPAEQQMAVDSAVHKHLSGEYPLEEEETGRPPRTLTILCRLRTGSRSAWSRWRASADTRADLASNRADA